MKYEFVSSSITRNTSGKGRGDSIERIDYAI
jgi:hypothetical protein